MIGWLICSWLGYRHYPLFSPLIVLAIGLAIRFAALPGQIDWWESVGVQYDLQTIILQSVLINLAGCYSLYFMGFLLKKFLKR